MRKCEHCTKSTYMSFKNSNERDFLNSSFTRGGVGNDVALKFHVFENIKTNMIFQTLAGFKFERK